MKILYLTPQIGHFLFLVLFQTFFDIFQYVQSCKERWNVLKFQMRALYEMDMETFYIYLKIFIFFDFFQCVFTVKVLEEWPQCFDFLNENILCNDNVDLQFVFEKFCIVILKVKLDLIFVIWTFSSILHIKVVKESLPKLPKSIFQS